MLARPRITILRGASGGARPRPDQPGASPASAQAIGRGGLFSLPPIDGLTITGGEIRHVDARSGRALEVREFELRVGHDPAAPVLVVDGSTSVLGEPVRLEGRLPAADKPTGPDGGAFLLAAQVPGGSLRAEGRMAAERLEARVELLFAELGRTFDWLNAAQGLPADTARRLAVVMELYASPAVVSLSRLQLELDEMRAEGAIRAELAGGRPFVEARLATGRLDLSPYLPEKRDKAAQSSDPVHGKDKGWPSEPIILPLPLSIDLSLTVDFAALKLRQLEFGQGILGVRVEGRRVLLEVPRLHLYGGTAQAEATLEAASAHRLRGSLQLAEVDLHPLLSAILDFTRLEGLGGGRVEFETQGVSVRDMVAALDGAGEVRLRDGVFRGINIAAMVQQVMTLGRDGADAPERTDFAEVGGTFSIRDGVLVSDDVALNAPLLRLAARGSVDLPARELDWRIEPHLVTSLGGQGATSAPGFQAGVPIRLFGPWSDPNWEPELGEGVREVLTDPARLHELIGKLQQRPDAIKALHQRLESAVEGLFGGPAAKAPADGSSGGRAGDSPGGGRAPAPGLSGKAGDLLRDLLGR